MRLLLASFLICKATALCYYPDGSTAPQDTPCTDSGDDTFCCGQGYICLSNRICMNNPSALDPNSTTYVRGSCTDQAWNSPNCPLFCVNGNSPAMDDTAGGEGMSKCSDTTLDSYCCIDFDQQACDCSTGKGTVRFDGQPSALTTIGVTATSTSTSTTTSSSSSSTLSTTTTSPAAASSSSTLTTAAAASTTASSSSSVSTATTASTTSSTPVAPFTDSTATPTVVPGPSSNKDTAIGAGVGVPLGVLLLALIAFYIVRSKRLKRRRAPTIIGGIATEQDHHNHTGSLTSRSDTYYLADRSSAQPTEAYSDDVSRHHELLGSQKPYSNELPANQKP